MKMKLVVFGEGRLAKAIKKYCEELNIRCVLVGRKYFGDFTKRDWEGNLTFYWGDVFINTAAATNLDWCEKNHDEAYEINANFPRTIAELCNRLNKPLIHVSTCGVYGDSDEEYSIKRLDSFCNPETSYAITKFCGEQGVSRYNNGTFSIVRTSWLYSDDINDDKYIATIFRKLMIEKQRKFIVNDQWGKITYTPKLAKFLVRLAKKKFNKQLNEKDRMMIITDTGITNRYRILRAMLETIDEQTEWKEFLSEEVEIKINKDFDRVRHCHEVTECTYPVIGYWQENLETNVKKLLTQL
jgi:dTDP-4-dehydrorhamnose reductase